MANFCTLNPLSTYPNIVGGTLSDIALSEGNLKITTTIPGGVAWTPSIGSVRITSGKWYWEYTFLSGFGNIAGIVNADSSDKSLSYATGYRSNTGEKYVDNSVSAYGDALSTSDVIGVAFDADAETVTFFRNNVSQGSIAIGVNTKSSGAYAPVIYIGDAASFRVNFGQFPWRYDPPSGFVALSTENLAEPPISNLAAQKPEDYFNTVLYTGTGASVQIPVGFQPDLIWGKKRSAPAQNNWLIDSVRGAGVWLSSDGSGVEGSEPAGSSFTSTGFTTNNNSLFTYNTGAYVAWCWKAGGTAVTNNDGSLTTQVSANTDAGFSIITYTGAGSGVSTIGHGLSQAPEFWVTKPRTTVSDDQWFCCHVGIASDYYNYWLHWDNNSAAQNTAARWGGVAPTNSVISIGSNSTNKSGNYVCYAWHSVEGFSKFGSYTGNGSNDGPFVYVGFRPAYVMIKETSGTGSWLIVDTERDPYNESLTGKHIQADSTNAEQTAASRSPTFGIDYLSNGFKLRGSHDENNEAGQNYIYMAFAESPFKYSSAR